MNPEGIAPREHVFYTDHRGRGLEGGLMCPQQPDPVWRAEPDTIAKIAILKAFLDAWFQIFGRSRRDQNLLYVDGFAGPGHYANYSEGSPVAAMKAASEALAASGSAWRAGHIHCAFSELDGRVAAHLKEHLRPFGGNPRLHTHVL